MKVLIADESSHITTKIVSKLLIDGIAVESVSRFEQVAQKFASNDVDVCVLGLEIQGQD